MTVIACIDDLKRLHQKRTPRMFWDYCESGSYTEQTFRENTSDFSLLRLRQRVARDLSNRTLKSTMLGQEVTMPVGLCPVGSLGMQCADGEIKAARAAAAFGVPFTLSTMSICSIEDVAANSPAPFWFQLYVMRDEGFVDALIERARAAGCSALVLTLDLQLVGQRHKDVHNGLSSPPKPTLGNLLNIGTKPLWALGMAGTRRRFFGNFVGHYKVENGNQSLFDWLGQQFEPKLDWKKVERIRDKWGGKLILKGVLDPEDARLAAEIGADAITCSNHGGRQQDGCLSAIRMLPWMVDAVQGKTEVWLDSGIRSGQDVIKALGLGASATMIGRAFVHGLGAMGEAGVTKALEVIAKEMDTALALCGKRDIRDIGPEDLLIPQDFAGNWL